MTANVELFKLKLFSSIHVYSTYLNEIFSTVYGTKLILLKIFAKNWWDIIQLNHEWCDQAFVYLCAYLMSQIC